MFFQMTKGPRAEKTSLRAALWPPLYYSITQQQLFIETEQDRIRDIHLYNTANYSKYC